MIKGVHLYVLICGTLTACLGLVVIFGWYAGNQALVQINPAFAPMQYNTALGFLFCGLGLIAVSYRKMKAVSTLGGIACVLGVATLIQYIWDVDFGIDEFFIEPVFITKTSHPGRMAPMTAICFALSGLSFLFVNKKRPLAVSLAICVLIFAVMALIGYITQQEGLYGWGNLTRMAIHTASGFVVLAIGMVIYNLWGVVGKKFDFWQIAPFLVAMVIALLSFFSWYVIREEAKVANHNYLLSLVNDTQDALVTRYKLYEASLWGGLGLYYASKSVEREEWQNYVKALDVGKNLPGISGIGYIDYVLAQDMNQYLKDTRADDAPNFKNHPDTFYPDKFIIKYIEPVDDNIEAVGLDIGFEANRRAAAERARDLGVPALTKKILLVQDHKKQAGFLLLIPVYETKDLPDTIEKRRKHFQGWVYAPFIGSNFFTGIEKIGQKQLNFEVFDGKKPAKGSLIYDYKENAEVSDISSDFVQTQLNIAGRTWTILWHPNKNFITQTQDNQGYVFLIFGWLFAGLLYFALDRFIKSKDIIQRTVDERTKELKESENRHRAILDNTVDAILTINEKGEIQGFNRAAEAMFGYTDEEMVGQNVSCLMPEPHKKQHDHYIENYMKTGEAKIIGTTRELEAVRKNGEVFPIELSVSDVELDHGKLFSGIIRDITKQKEAEIAKNESIEFQELVANNIPDFLFVKDDEFRIVDANDAFLELYPEDIRENVIGSTTIENYKEEDAEAFLKHDKIALKDGYSETEEVIVFPNGQLHTLFTKKVRFKNTKGETFILGIARDITDAKEAEEQILKANEELSRSNQELERFAYIASHDLQEPLRKIGGFTERFEKHFADQIKNDEKAQTYMRFITDGVERMRGLIMGLLEYSRVTTTEIDVQALDSNQIVADAIENLSERIEENEARIHYEDLPVVAYDKIMLTQLFQNLIGNAIKYRSEAAPEITITAQVVDGFWEFAVADNGMGMEEKYLDRIFEMFQRLHRKEEISGTGIGLSLCQKIVERYGGKIRVTSEPDKGSTFYFTVPITSDI